MTASFELRNSPHDRKKFLSQLYISQKFSVYSTHKTQKINTYNTNNPINYGGMKLQIMRFIKT